MKAHRWDQLVTPANQPIDIDRWLARRGIAAGRLTIADMDQLARLLAGQHPADRDTLWAFPIGSAECAEPAILKADNQALQIQLRQQFAAR